MHQTIPQAHPQASEPLIDDHSFSIELWSDWVLLDRDIEAYRRASHEIAIPHMSDEAYEVNGLASVDEGILWVSISLAGPGSPGDAHWALIEDLFHQFWESIHTRAMI